MSTPTRKLKLAGGAMDSAANITLSGGGELLGLPASPSATGAASKEYVDGLVGGATSSSWKTYVRVVSTSNISLTGEQTIDGVAVVAGDRVLVAAQTTPTECGIYIASAGAWARSSDADEDGELDRGATVIASEGSTAGSIWTLVSSTGGFPQTQGWSRIVISGQFSTANVNINEGADSDFDYSVKAKGFITTGSALPAGPNYGIALTDTSAASANPTTASVLYSVSGELQYRTSGASEGAGQTNRVHNRAASVTGAGTDYTLTNSTSRVDFGTTDAEVALPSAGTYLVQANVQIQGDAIGAADEIRAKLYNSTDAAQVGEERSQTTAVASSFESILLSAIVTVTATKTIQIYAHNATSARGTIIAAKTTITYVRMY